MAAAADTINMAVFCDFENVALGVRDAQYERFDIKPVLERLLVKGNIVVKKAYCDWERYKAFKAGMHEANFELIEIPHVRQSGKNSADIRLVVDALDLCYTKAHVDAFVIISGDSDFSPLVSKLRENAKRVIGVGVKQSTSDLLIANCDEFIFYDDLVRQREAKHARKEAQAPREPRKVEGEGKEEGKRRDDLETRRNKGVELAATTFEDLMAERDDSDRIWASVLKEAIKRRSPGFNESYYGFRAFGNLLEEAQNRGLLTFGRDEKSGAYVMRHQGAPLVKADSPLRSAHPVHEVTEVELASAPEEAPVSVAAPESTPEPQAAQAPAAAPASAPVAKEGGREGARSTSRRRRRNTRSPDVKGAYVPGQEEDSSPVETAEPVSSSEEVSAPAEAPRAAVPTPVVEEAASAPAPAKSRNSRSAGSKTGKTGKKTSGTQNSRRRKIEAPAVSEGAATPSPAPVSAAPASVTPEGNGEAAPAGKKPRARRPRKAKAATE